MTLSLDERRIADLKEWMPHVTLLYPFRPWQGDPLPELAAAVATVEPTPVTLAEFRSFRHGPTSHTIWLSPEPAEALVRLQRALVAAFPDCNDTSRYEGGYTPHLSVGQAHDPRELLQRLQRDWRPILFPLDAVALIVRDADGVFHVERTFPLGKS